MSLPACPYCGRPTEFYGLLATPKAWTRWESCDPCRRFFYADEVGNPLGERFTFSREDPTGRWDPPKEWLLPVPEIRGGGSGRGRPPGRPAPPARRERVIGSPGSSLGQWPASGPGTRFYSASEDAELAAGEAARLLRD